MPILSPQKLLKCCDQGLNFAVLTQVSDKTIKLGNVKLPVHWMGPGTHYNIR